MSAKGDFPPPLTFPPFSLSSPSKLHERSPIFMGSKDDVEDVLKIIEKHRSDKA